MPDESAGPSDQALLSGIALATFRANGAMLELAESLARPADLTAARWQVLGAVVDRPDTASGIARAMGVTRQSVQRLADLLVADGHLVQRPNPAHARANLLELTESGSAAMQRIGPQHATAAENLVTRLGHARAVRLLHDLAVLADAAHDVAKAPQ